MVMPFVDNSLLEIKIRMDKGRRVWSKMFFLERVREIKKIQTKLYLILTQVHAG